MHRNDEHSSRQIEIAQKIEQHLEEIAKLRQEKSRFPDLERPRSFRDRNTDERRSRQIEIEQKIEQHLKEVENLRQEKIRLLEKPRSLKDWHLEQEKEEKQKRDYLPDPEEEFRRLSESRLLKPISDKLDAPLRRRESPTEYDDSGKTNNVGWIITAIIAGFLLHMVFNIFVEASRSVGFDPIPVQQTQPR